VSTPSILERLSAHRMLAAVPRKQLEWVANHGSIRTFDSGAVLTAKDGQVEGLHIVLSGYFAIYVDRGAGRRKIMEWRAGDVTGFLPYSRLVSAPGDVTAEEPSEVFTVPREYMEQMTRDCYELTAAFVHVMLDRARHFQASYLHDEKLVSLGKLSAGLAHELNNPASAIARSASALVSSLLETEDAARLLGSACLSTEQIAVANKLREAGLSGGVRVVLSPLKQEEREDAIIAWLEKHHADASVAEALAETDVTFDLLDQLAASIQGPALNAALRWVAAGCASRRLASEIHEASSRIYDLVGAIKGFTEMDRASVPEPVDVERGMANTLVVLRAKAKEKSVALSLNVGNDLPRVNGFGGELNQVWLNLIDNALDAVNEGGRVELMATREGDKVVVRVIDDGPGVPAEIRDRIFDPFFSTKPTGKGTGLGLDIVRRLVQRHNGLIQLESQPGRTEFRVTLPVAESQRRVVS
jgi:signal transduction histidine kinase